MNALSLYITACRSILQSPPDDSSVWIDIHRLLTYLRQSLLCCACGNLLIVPMTSRSCQQHGICKSCLGRPVACLRCKEYEGFVEDTRLQFVLLMYKQLCSYLCLTQHRPVGTQNGGNGINFSDLIQEGAAYCDETNRQSESIQPSCDAAVNGNKCVTNGNYVKVKVEPAEEEQDVIESPRKRLRAQTKSKSAKSKERQGCRCGMTTANPGKLTCYGQRCPCYAKNVPCNNCRCRGCHNPRRARDLDETNRKRDSDVTYEDCYLSVKSKKK